MSRTLHIVRDGLRSGAWLTRDRVSVYSAMLLIAYGAVTILWFASARDGLDRQNRPFGNDFAEVYAAGTLVREGHPEQPYDIASHFARQQALFGAHTAVYTWNYPPFFLAVAGLLAFLPYLAAFATWTLTTAALALAAARPILATRTAWLAALALPAGYINLAHGQTGFLITALFVGALGALDRRPILAGMLFGLLACKPQFALLVPVALVAGGHGRALGAALAAGAGMIAATYLGFGAEPFLAFLGNLDHARRFGLEASDTGFAKMQSVFAAARLLGGAIPLAYALQALVSAGVAAAVAVIWRQPRDDHLRGAALLAGAVLATPYCFDYDLVLLGPAIGLLVARGATLGFLAYEKTLIALAWTVPLFARVVAQATHLPVGLMGTCALFCLILRHAWALSPRRQPPEGVTARPASSSS